MPRKLTPRQERLEAEKARADALKRGRAVYVIGWQEAGPIKVGMATRPERRLGDLQIGNPYPLRLFRSWALGAVAGEVEDVAKDRLYEKALVGEWFAVDVAAAAAVIETIMAETPPGWIGKTPDELDAFVFEQWNQQGYLAESQLMPRKVHSRRHYAVIPEVLWEPMVLPSHPTPAAPP